MEPKDENQAHGNSDVIHIIVNARPKEIEATQITYAELVQLAYPNSGDYLYSITYTGPQIADGCLAPDQSVELRNGMKFDVIRTNKS